MTGPRQWGGAAHWPNGRRLNLMWLECRRKGPHAEEARIKGVSESLLAMRLHGWKAIGPAL
jgi:hypothetical protein